MEILRRIDTLGKKKDYEMLKLMVKDAKVVAPVTTNVATKKPRTVAAKKRPRATVNEEDEQDEEEFLEDTSSKRRKSSRSLAAAPVMSSSEEDDDDDDDLFDSDEEEEANARVTKSVKKSDVKTSKLKKAPAKKAKSRWDEYEEEEDEDYYSDEDRGVSSSSRLVLPPASAPLLDEDECRREPEVEDTSPPAELEDYQRIQVRRAFVEKWLLEPYFEKAVKHQFCRIYIGQNPTTSKYKPLFIP